MPEEIELDPREDNETLDELRREHAEHVKEEAAAHGWTRFISLSTAVLAVVAAIAALQSGSLVNEALLEQNKAVQNQAQASDQWAYYQAKGIKSNTAQQTADLLAVNAGGAARAEQYRAEAKRYKEEQKELQAKATELEKERDERNLESTHFMHRHHIFAYCVTFTQVAIALSAIAALMRRKPIWYLSLAVGTVGIVLLAQGFLAR